VTVIDTPIITPAVAERKAQAETIAAIAQARRFDAEAAHFAALTVQGERRGRQSRA
jgi:hypothetical protein